MPKKTLFLTGATGAIGGPLGRRLEGKFELTRFTGDIRDIDEIARQMPETVDVVIHLAALVPIREVDANPLDAYETNAIGTFNLIKSLGRKNLSPYFFYASTSHVYKPSQAPLKEESEIDPQNIYAQSKFAGEKIVEHCHRGEFCIGRIFSFYADSQKPPFLFPTLKQRLASEDLSQPFALHGADSVRDFSSVEDICDLLVRLIEKRAPGIFNIASGEPITVAEFAQKLSPQALTIRSVGKSNTFIADTGKLKQHL